ncbi:phage integrase N-terminal SAM-like domain-containing protein [Vreelandella sulfidaeris]|uniref:phage integrase N-terminal SAM-like domain-containing protein n=1 Tax=Vreelandella sulfidaeris TaxID=115553 RepID=UPI0035EFF9BE
MKLMERVKETLRVKCYSLRTEKSYCYWIRFFIRFHRMRPPATILKNARSKLNQIRPICIKNVRSRILFL